ncbi:3-oxoacyl-[acyl-carrier protein] reductase [Buchnera aphidicola (Nipponaphis monzeni)]|uniref:3-oxoacyl-[acyl-carrier-protein] reductase FabG n=1 Tax=Buchnera aphidicola (Nipponaphis monzeni) TaxID=2495405 RepID=A0A455TAC9_9GAMM|nr:beta-ketoacyl-ACP reductase [Buchnera aphidicola]BBI01279.1 3-oxoacyl-[acyl-carrier protein] reductase [Buchnera aphidicola (Nipponaphis monzeni)]
MNINNKIALVTGANRGIGKYISKKLAKNGAIVIGTSTSLTGVNQINKFLNNKCQGMILDITDSNAIKYTVKTIHNKFEHIDILVNNAGIIKDNILLKMPFKDWINVLNTNLTSIFNITKSVIKKMVLQKKGRIITIGSVIGDIGNYGQTNYSASKSGIIGFNKSLALEVASRGITVNIVSPGFINNGMTKKIKNLKKIMSKIPMLRFGTAEDVANAVLFLASDYSSYITGETLHVNGGLFMK